MVDYEMVHYPPSLLACGAFALTLKVLDSGEWVSLLTQRIGPADQRTTALVFMSKVAFLHQ